MRHPGHRPAPTSTGAIAGGHLANGEAVTLGFTSPISAREVLAQRGFHQLSANSAGVTGLFRPHPLTLALPEQRPQQRDQQIFQNHLAFLTSPKRIEHSPKTPNGLLHAPQSTSTTTRSHERNVRSFAGEGYDLLVAKPSWQMSARVSEGGGSPSRVTELQVFCKRAPSP